MRIEQVCGAVQCDDRLAGSGPTLDGVHARKLRPDDLVLFGLDRSDDVAEATGAGGLQRQDQGALAPQPVPVVVTEPIQVTEQLVLHAQQAPTPAHEVPASLEAHRNRTGGPVEGLGDRCAPVHQHRLLVHAPDPDPPDVIAPAAGIDLLVDATEHQRCVTHVQLVEPVRHRLLDGLPLETGLVRAAPAHLHHRRELERAGPRRFQAGIRLVDVGLFCDEFGMFDGHRGTSGA